MALTKNQAVDYDRSDDLIGLGMEADRLRRSLHPEGVVTYIVDGKVRYASLSRKESRSTVDGPLANELLPQHPDDDLSLNFDAIHRQIAQTTEMGGTCIVLQGQPDRNIASFKRLIQEIRRRFPQISLDCFPAPEILAIATHSGISIRDTLASLRDAGLDSIPGDGAGIFGDDARHHAGQQCSAEDWLNVHRTAHQLGLRTTAAMTFGRGETFAQRFHHLDEIRQLQEETGGFAAFFPLNFKPKSVPASSPGALESRKHEDATAVEYLKVLAIARLHLDTIANMQCSWTAHGLKVLQLSLRFGGNDAGSVTLAGNAGQDPGQDRGTANSVTEEQLRHVIRGAGFKPVQRDALYATCLLN